MAGMLHNLENNEAVVLMYLAGELPPEDREEVEALLSRDAGLRALLEAIQAAQESTGAALEAADADATVPFPEGAATRRASRLVRQWATERLAHPVATNSGKGGLPFPWWSYPLASAACVLIGFLAVWGLRGGDNSGGGNSVVTPTTPITAADLTTEDEQAIGGVVNPDDAGIQTATDDASDQPPPPLPSVAEVNSSSASLDAIEAALDDANSTDELNNIFADISGPGSVGADRQGTP